MKSDDLPAAVRKHPELARLLKYAQNNPEAEEALAEFFRVCGQLTRAQLAEVFTYGASVLAHDGDGDSRPGG